MLVSVCRLFVCLNIKEILFASMNIIANKLAHYITFFANMYIKSWSQDKRKTEFEDITRKSKTQRDSLGKKDKINENLGSRTVERYVQPS